MEIISQGEIKINLIYKSKKFYNTGPKFFEGVVAPVIVILSVRNIKKFSIETSRNLYNSVQVSML